MSKIRITCPKVEYACNATISGELPSLQILVDSIRSLVKEKIQLFYGQYQESLIEFCICSEVSPFFAYIKTLDIPKDFVEDFVWRISCYFICSYYYSNQTDKCVVTFTDELGNKAFVTLDEVSPDTSLFYQGHSILPC